MISGYCVLRQSLSLEAPPPLWLCAYTPFWDGTAQTVPHPADRAVMIPHMRFQASRHGLGTTGCGDAGRRDAGPGGSRHNPDASAEAFQASFHVRASRVAITLACQN